MLSKLADENDAEFFGHLDHETLGTVEQAMKGIVRRQGLRQRPIE